MAKKRNLLTAVEIGTSTLKVLVAAEEPDGGLAYLTHHQLPTNGAVMKGEIIDGPAVRDLLVEAFTSLEGKFKGFPGVVCLALSGQHIECQPVHATVALYGDSTVRESHKKEIDTKLRQNRHIGRTVLFCEPHTYYVDEAPKLEPVGLVGARVSGSGFMASASDNGVHTLDHMFKETLGEEDVTIAFPGVAAYSGLDPSQHLDGTLVVDIGAGVTEFGLFVGNQCVHCGLICVGADHVANDVSVGLNLTIERAREAVERYGAAVQNSSTPNRKFPVSVAPKQNRNISESALNTIIECRLRETLTIVRDHLAENEDLDRLQSMALCGGGAMISGVDALASDIFKCHAVRSIPEEFSNLDAAIKSPRWVTAAGMLRWGQAVLHHKDDSPGGFDMFKTEIVNMLGIMKDSLRI